MSVDRARLFREDATAGPDALEALLDAWQGPGGLGDLVPLDRLEGKRLLFTGMGSSRFAALDVAAELRRSGIDAHVEVASAGRPIPAAADLVLFAVSSSGRTPEVVAAVRRHRGTSFVVGVTNRPHEPVGAEADVCLPLLAGEETGGIACRTYAATLAVLGLAAERLMVASDTAGTPLPAHLRDAVRMGRELRATAGQWLRDAAGVLDRADEIHVVGDGAAAGGLEQAALMLREAPRLRALPVDAGDWLHVALYTMLPGARALLLAGTPYDDEVVRTVTGRGGRAVVIGGTVQGAAACAQIPGLEALPSLARTIVLAGAVELLAAELWEATTGQLKEP
jgi:glutamine---fructose-6-phosphate transaminase (isomerizing)